MQTPTQTELMDNVKVPDWYRFSISLLNGDDQTVNMIQRDPAHQGIEAKLAEVFRIWLEKSEEPTWNAVVAVLKEMKNNRLAREIQKKFC